MKMPSHVLGILLVALGILICRPGYAAVIAVTPTPPVQNAAFGASSMVRIIWNVNYLSGAPDVTSPAGTLRAGIGGPVIATVPVQLRRTFPLVVGPPSPVNTTFSESVPISEQAVLIAQQLGFSQLSYERTFDDGSGPATGAAIFNITGSAGAALSLSRIALRFPDNTRVKVMARDATTHVLADLSFTGSGRLEAIWEIAEPSSTMGNPSFRTLRLIRRQLIGTGQQITLRSPDLPTRATGLYLVRLRVTSPSLSFESPVIRYFVNASMKSVALPAIVQTIQPADGATVDKSTRFEWKPVPGATVYQVEFHARAVPSIATQIPSLGENHVGVPEEGEDKDKAQGYPLAGIMVGGSTRELSLGGLTLNRLTPGSTYAWRVQAYDARGELIGSSPLQVVVMPDKPKTKDASPAAAQDVTAP